MTRYGYLQQPDPRIGTMLSSDDVTLAVKSLQHVRGLKETGSLQDPDTAALVDGTRCAVPDYGPADSARRKRRYAIHGTVWNKTVSCRINLHILKENISILYSRPVLNASCELEKLEQSTDSIGLGTYSQDYG